MPLDSVLLREGYTPTEKNAHVKIQANTCVITPRCAVFVTDEHVYVGKKNVKNVLRALEIAELCGVPVRGLTH